MEERNADKLDIFALDPETKVIVTVMELRNLYIKGFEAGDRDSLDEETLVEGEIA